MPLNESKPNDATLFSQLDDFQRETREYINDLESTLLGNSYTYTELSYVGGTVEVGEDVSDVNLEFIEITAASPETLSNMQSGREGQIKHFIARDSNVTIEQAKSSTTGGSFRLNAPGGEDLSLSTNDVVVFVNVGGDGGNSTDGYWQEIYRTLAV
jgi:hypothetical protein